MNDLKSVAKTLSILLIGIFLLGITNPSKDTHQTEIKNKFNQQNPIAGTFGGGYITSKVIEYKNYGVFSVSKIEKGVGSIGILGMVFVSDLDI